MGLLLASLIIGLAMCELATRLFGLAPAAYSLKVGLQKSVYKAVSNPILGYLFKEGYRDAHNPDLMSSYPAINAHGQRDVERKMTKPSGKKRIILLGDSVVAGAKGIPALEDTISGQLERMLDPRGIEVLNFGVNGYCTRAEVELLRVRGLAFSPDLVVLIFVANDYDNSNNDLGSVSLRKGPLVESLFLRSALFRLLGLRLNLFNLGTEYGLLDAAGQQINQIGEEARSRIKSSRRDTVAGVARHLNAIGSRNVEEGLALLKDLSARGGFEVAIGVWPLFIDGGVGDYETAPGRESRAVGPREPLYVEELASRLGITTFRFSPNFRAASGASPPAAYAVDLVHPNAAGARIAALALRDFLRRNPGLLGKD